MCKVWLACDVVAGELTATEGARMEGIIEARWFTRAALELETVYPWIVKERDWLSFSRQDYPAEVSPTREATF